MIGKVIHKLISFIFPIYCFNCGKEKKSYLCGSCLEKLLIPALPLKLKSCPKIYSACFYNNPGVKKILWLYKYRGKRGLADILAKIILQNITYFSIINKKSHSLIPVPISNKKLRQRGYNQSAVIAKIISKKTGIPCFENILYKKTHTISQVETKNKEERKRNLKNSFGIKNDYKNKAREINKDSVIILFDDIITTGATLNEAAKTLRKAGFKNIIGITVARGGG